MNQTALVSPLFVLNPGDGRAVVVMSMSSHTLVDVFAALGKARQVDPCARLYRATLGGKRWEQFFDHHGWLVEAPTYGIPVKVLDAARGKVSA